MTHDHLGSTNLPLTRSYPVVSPDAEIAAMNTCMEVLRGLHDEGSARRVVDYLKARVEAGDLAVLARFDWKK